MEGKEAMEEPYSIFSKVQSLGGKQDQVVSLLRLNTFISLQKVSNNTTSSRFIQKVKKKMYAVAGNSGLLSHK